MTSIERTGDNTYGSDKEPIYSVLTYTWGRYEVHDGPCLKISGIPWTVPAIAEHHFTVQHFERVLHQMASTSSYVWLDVACINQGASQAQNAEKMHQVGRQAGIFRRARQAYIWLNQSEPRQLREYISAILKTAYELANLIADAETALPLFQQSIDLLFRDPWFSSLWTLQESVLKRNAYILDREGEYVIAPGPWAGSDTRVQLMDIAGACELFRELLEPRLISMSIEPENGLYSLRTGIELMRNTVDKSGIGFSFAMNPNVQYSAARFRQTRYETDRIYAIMQVFGFRLGQALEPAKHFTKAQLELQFLTSISQVPMIAQAFIHLTAPPTGQSWAITPEITVPRCLQRIIVHNAFLSNSCSITIHSRTRASFAGKYSTLEQLLKDWVKHGIGVVEGLRNGCISMAWAAGSGSSIYWNGVRKYILLDHNEDALGPLSGTKCEWPQDTDAVDSNADRILETEPGMLEKALKSMQEIVDALEKRFGVHQTRVLYLGRSRYQTDLDIALILVKQRSGFLSSWTQWSTWTRAGLCVWGAMDRNTTIRDSAQSQFQSIAWHEMTGAFG